MEFKSVSWLGAVGLVLLAGSCTDEGVMYLTRVSDEGTGSNCTDGGQKLDFGADTDADGVLTTPEVTASTFVCNGAASRGASITNTPLLPGDANCLHGGFALTVGVDENGNGEVDPYEGTTRFSCNSPPASTGPQGPQGIPGSDGNDGNDGARGDAGAESEDGAEGAPGATGPEGPPGATGATGPEGPPGADGPLGGPGDFCVDDAECSSNNCDIPDTECVQGTVADGAACTTDAQCASNDCDTVTANTCTAPPPLASLGSICDNDDECISDSCEIEVTFLVCVEGGRADGQPCTDDTQCSNDCDSGTGLCATTPLAAVGNTCAVDADCTSDNCGPSGAFFACAQGTRANGQPCTDDTQCLNDCITGQCAAPPAPIGGACNLDNECISGNCGATVCEEGTGAFSSPCTDDTQCSLDCDELNTSQCTGAAIGNTCTLDAECISDNCDPPVCAQGTRGDGASCGNDTQCANNDCETLDTFICLAP